MHTIAYIPHFYKARDLYIYLQFNAIPHKNQPISPKSTDYHQIPSNSLKLPPILSTHLNRM